MWFNRNLTIDLIRKYPISNSASYTNSKLSIVSRLTNADYSMIQAAATVISITGTPQVMHACASMYGCIYS